MSRLITSCLQIQGVLVAETPLHIGGGDEGPDADLTLAINGMGQFYVPGTSLAGPLRAWNARRAPDLAPVNDLWGFLNGSSGHASFLMPEDSVLELPSALTAEVRDGVGIDRFTGGAATRYKYNRAVLPRGVRLPLNITWEMAATHGSIHEALISDLVQALEDGDVRFGAGKTRGLGRVRFDAPPTISQQILNTPTGMLAALRGLTSPVALWRDLNLLRPLPRIDIRIDWLPNGPLLVKAAQDGLVVDGLPLVSGTGDRIAPVLPGSAVKGVLRSHAERLIRTHLPLLPLHRKFADQVRVPLVTSLFGDSGCLEETGPEVADDLPLPGLAALSVDDCYSDSAMTLEQWQKITQATDMEELQAALLQAGVPDWRQAVHVAIDRWTGGAAPGLLFSLLEPRGQTWEPLRLRLDLTRLVPGEQAPAIILLLLVLRDVIRGTVSFGYGTNDGQGRIQVTGLSVLPRDMSGPLAAVDAIKLDAQKFLRVPSPLVDTLNQEWQAWLAQAKLGEGQGRPAQGVFE